MATNSINPVTSNEPLTRYIYSRKLYGGGKVKHGAFWPKNGEVSIYRIKGWSATEVGDEGMKIGEQRGLSLKGRGDFQWGRLEGKVIVRIYPDPPPSRHANIRDFPQPREKVQEQATILANESKLVLFSPQK